jgi:hypothetical protein
MRFPWVRHQACSSLVLVRFGFGFFRFWELDFKTLNIPRAQTTFHVIWAIPVIMPLFIGLCWLSLAFVGHPWLSLACVGRHEPLWACIRLDWRVVLVSEN